MHGTRSVDYAVVLSGEIEMKLDDSMVRLKPGDVDIHRIRRRRGRHGRRGGNA
jgi:mannose-6-phosphate isomerase-like protein (cupin superfamily)